MELVSSKTIHSILIGIFALLASCQKADTMAPETFLIMGMAGFPERPERPENSSLLYDPLTGIEITWDPALLPASGLPAPFYRLYYYYEFPQTFYQQRNLLTETTRTEHRLFLEPFDGNLFFVVTASNGRSESLPGDILALDFNDYFLFGANIKKGYDKSKKNDR